MIIRQEPNRPAPPLTPVIIRKRMKTPATPAPIIIRERPPDLPKLVPQQVVTIPGKVLPNKRPIIFQKIESTKTKPPMVIIERWLPYPPQQKRRVIYEKMNEDPKKKERKGERLFFF